LQRALKIASTNTDRQGKIEEVAIILRFIEQSADLPPGTLQWTPEKPVVAANGEIPPIDQQPQDTIRALLADQKTTAHVTVGRDAGGKGVMKGVSIGGFPSETWARGGEEDRSQVINLDHLLAFQEGAPGMGAALAMHEIFENYMAHQQYAGAAKPYDPSHEQALALEGKIAAKLTKAGRRLSHNADVVGDIVHKQGDDHFGGQKYMAVPSKVEFEFQDLYFTHLIGPGQDSFKFVDIRLVDKKQPAGKPIESIPDISGRQKRDGGCTLF
jgi:hypothetical protein